MAAFQHSRMGGMPPPVNFGRCASIPAWASDQARLSNLAARVHFNEDALAMSFDPANTAMLRLAGARPEGTGGSRPVSLSGQLSLLNVAGPASFRFEGFNVRSDAASLAADGEWNHGVSAVTSMRATPLE